MRAAYGPEPNVSVELMAATVYFNDAFAIFDARFQKYKQRPFQGEDKKYLDFYLKRTSRSK